MDVYQIAKSNDRETYRFVGFPTSFVNYIRRKIISSIPTRAIDAIVVTHNNTILNDETIAHRLALLPLTSDYLDEDAHIMIDVHNDTLLPMSVTSTDIHINNINVSCLHENVIICPLLAGQSLMLTASTVAGTGKTHAKWSAGLAYMSFADKKQIQREEKTDPPLDILPDIKTALTAYAQLLADRNMSHHITETNRIIDLTVETMSSYTCHQLLAKAIDLIINEELQNSMSIQG